MGKYDAFVLENYYQVLFFKCPDNATDGVWRVEGRMISGADICCLSVSAYEVRKEEDVWTAGKKQDYMLNTITRNIMAFALFIVVESGSNIYTAKCKDWEG